MRGLLMIKGSTIRAVAILFFIWALIAMLFGQVQEDSATIAIVGVGLAILAR